MASAEARTRSGGRDEPAADKGASTRGRSRRPSFQSNRRRDPRRRSSRQRTAGQRVEGALALLGRVRVGHHRRRAEGIAETRTAGPRPLGRHVANLLARLRGPAVSRPDLLKHFRGDAAGRALVFQTLEHLGFSPKEHLEQLAQLLGTCLFLTSRLQGLAVFLGLVPQGYELLAGGRRLLLLLRRRGSEPARRAARGH